MTLTLTPEAEAHLAAVAAQRGLPPEDALSAVLAEESRRLANAQAEFDAAVADVQASLDDFAAGRGCSLEEYRAEAHARRQERDNGPAISEAV